MSSKRKSPVPITKQHRSYADHDKARSNVTVTSGYSCSNKHGNGKINGAEKTLSYFQCSPDESPIVINKDT